MRKLLLSLACVAAAVPAVALAADEDDVQVSGTTPQADERPADARQKAKRGQARIERTHERAEKRRQRARARKRARARARVNAGGSGGGATPAHLQAIAACESGGNPSAVGGGGAFRGKYQFDRGTWASVGGSGDPAAAPEAEQDRRAAILYSRAGSSPWPVCGS
ncbi:MAG TPA: transglycosylase family protein [Thermoleophilaceae bacterium]|jgi:soluble lytic murein transglycosylase-like protein